jgi:hypothetical protein
MKQQWTSQELIDHWALTQNEIVLAQSISKIDHNQLGYALMLSIFKVRADFPSANRIFQTKSSFILLDSFVSRKALTSLTTGQEEHRSDTAHISVHY